MGAKQALQVMARREKAEGESVENQDSKVKKGLIKRKVSLITSKQKERNFVNFVKSLKAEKQNLPVRPPFSNLKSFHVCAIVLSYLVFQEDASEWIMRLSPNSIRYLIGHKEMINAFVMSNPRVLSTIEFDHTF